MGSELNQTQKEKINSKKSTLMYTKSIGADFGNMDLLCRESVILNDCQDFGTDPADNVLNACKDPTFLNERILENLLRAEEKYTPIGSYFGTMQTDITPAMRKIVSEWMLEVSSHMFFFLNSKLVLEFFLIIPIFFNATVKM